MNALNNVDSIKIDQSEVKDVTNLYEHKGKDFYYKETLKKEMQGLTNMIILQNIKVLAEIRELKVAESRYKILIKPEAKPKNKEEQMIKNIADVLRTFAEHIDQFDLLSNQFLNLAKSLFKDIKGIEFTKKKKLEQINLITTEKTINTRNLLDEMLIKYSSLLKSRKYEIVSLVASFLIDFIMEGIFNDENEFIALFVVYALLFKEDFELFRFNPFFEAYHNNMDEYKDSLAKSEFGWAGGYPNASYITKTLRKIMIESYSRIDIMIKGRTITQSNQKTNMIESTILKRLPEVFTKADIAAYHPEASKTTIDRTLARLRDENKIKPNGTGRSASWVKIYKEDKFNKDQLMKQFTIADYVPEEDEDR
ncbi:MAG: hypothetical protein K6G48_00505 [Acholeplasmatales bacterium]|nr:hypothetical protein [Acholeplasmatales bacterium]